MRDRYIPTFEAIGYQKAEIHVDLSYGYDKGMTGYMKPVAAAKPPVAAGSKISAHELSMASDARELDASGRKKFYVDKQPQAALRDLEHAVAIAPNYYETYFEITMAYATLGKKDNAKENFRKSMVLAGLLQTRKTELIRGQLGKALASADRAKVLAPNTPIVYRLLSNAAKELQCTFR